MVELKIYKLHDNIIVPKFATKGSACFDIAYQTVHTKEVSGFDVTNAPIRRIHNAQGHLAIMPGDRLLVPTGLIFDIPTGYSLRLHARSGLSLKNGLILANSEAVIDSDYVMELMVMLTNISTIKQVIITGDRIAQAELVPVLEYDIGYTETQPIQKTDRVGGLGSTGLTTT